MNGVKTENHVRVEQTARGIWYCSSFDVYGDGLISLKYDLDEGMKTIEGVLQEHNKIIEGDKSSPGSLGDIKTTKKDKKVET